MAITMGALARPAFGVGLAIAITTSMDANGLSNFSALPLFPLFALFWAWERLPRAAVGLTWAKAGDFGLALLHPLMVMGAVALAAAAAGAVDTGHTNWTKAALNLALVGGSTVLVAILTEEGFFRGWLWGSLRRAGLSPVLICTSLAFSLWHLSAVTLKTGFDLPLAQIPVFMINAAVIGVVWGLLRQISGSVVVSSLCHGLWNGLAYVLFGYGTKVGALGVVDTALFGPEVGYLGLALNAAFAGGLFLWWRRRGPAN